MRSRHRPLWESRMEASASAYFLGKAAQCRRLAQEILAKDDPAIATLLAMAAEFEGKAIVAATDESNAFQDNGRAHVADTQATGKDENGPENVLKDFLLR
jgi:hypothetical protein